jgi:hypothetical protein
VLSLILAVPAAGFLVRLFMIRTIAVTALSFALAWRMTG